MRKILFLFLAPLAFFSCDSKISQPKNGYFTRIEMDTLIETKCSVRALTIVNDTVWFGADKGTFGYYDLTANEKFLDTISGEHSLPEFRSIASTANGIFLLNVGSPALLYKVSKNGRDKKLVYKETHKDIFYDSMKFWNDKEGIAIGDPVEGCFSIIITHDGGETWKKISCENLPKLAEGEAAFAASNTNLVVNKKDTWIVSGGTKARVFYSPDKGKTWAVHTTPITQGLSMAGIFSADFYDENIGFIVGGNYDKPSQNSGNKALTLNGGKTWALMAENTGFGYADCVQFVPNSGGRQLVTVGFSGINYSSDQGKTWIQLSPDKGYQTIRFIDGATAVDAGKNKIAKIKFKK